VFDRLVDVRLLRARATLDLLLAGALVAGIAFPPLVLAHLAAVVLVLLAFWRSWRASTIRLVIALLATTLASARVDVPLREVVVQLPFVYGISGLVIVLADQVRRARATSQAAYEQARHLALFDPLTNLPNRTLLHERLEQAFAGDRARDGNVALIVLDLDRFKEVNDSFGHHAGDDLLRQVGGRLGTVLRDGDTVARLGGDEFAALLPLADLRAAKEVAIRLRRALTDPFVVGGQLLDVGASLGVAVAPEHASDPDALLQHADVAMYAAKRALGGVAVYDRGLDDNAADRLSLMAELRRAIATDELLLHYQPIVDAKTGVLQKFEALLRWHHPVRGLLPPGAFIELAERSGLIRELSVWVLDAGVRQVRLWRDAGMPAAISLNLSMRNMLDPELPDAVGDLIAREGIDPGLVTLEITEGAFMTDQDRVAGTAARLRDLGVGLAIDDFGTGYSSLAYLSRLAVNEVKIDRSFVSGLLGDASCAAIVTASVELAHALGFTVVAEGVEDEATSRRLESAGVDALQGYHFARPMAADDVCAWLELNAPRTAVA